MTLASDGARLGGWLGERQQLHPATDVRAASALQMGRLSHGTTEPLVPQILRGDLTPWPATVAVFLQDSRIVAGGSPAETSGQGCWLTCSACARILHDPVSGGRAWVLSGPDRRGTGPDGCGETRA